MQQPKRLATAIKRCGYTLADAQALEPGREKNSLVAEIVLGWTRDGKGFWFKPNRPHSWNWDSLDPPDTTSGDGMLLVIKRMEEDPRRMNRFCRELTEQFGISDGLSAVGSLILLFHRLNPDAVANAALAACWNCD